MRLSADWQVLLDDRILELFTEVDEDDAFFSPSEIADDPRIRYSPQYVGRRCDKLADHDLLQRVSKSTYTITEKGRAYVNGEYDVESGRFVDDEAGNVGSVDMGSSGEV